MDCSGRRHDVEHGVGAFCEAEAAVGSRDDLVVTAAETEEVAELTMLATEAAGCVMALEAAHLIGSALSALVPITDLVAAERLT